MILCPECGSPLVDPSPRRETCSAACRLRRHRRHERARRATAYRLLDLFASAVERGDPPETLTDAAARARTLLETTR